MVIHSSEPAELDADAEEVLRLRAHGVELHRARDAPACDVCAGGGHEAESVPLER
jgi:hypothetical protein